ncbi:MAG: PhoU domain-containing protein [Candidatus Sedimenticola sp. (ex Thyasira tokunagai)]
MARYEKRLQEDLTHIRGQVRILGDMVEKVLNDAVHALLNRNVSLANETVLADHPINRQMREIDRICHGFIARHLPSAGHLRMISSIIRLNIALERVGDYAVTISREALQLKAPMEEMIQREVESLADESRQILHQALDAFHGGSAEAARSVMQLPGHLETTLNGVYSNLIGGEYTRDSGDLFAISVILTQLKRVADQSKNICEEALFATTGETKTKKVYSVLFVDRDNRSLSPMAEAIAANSHPNSGRYTSGGGSPGGEIDSALVNFMEQRGMDLSALRPKGLDYSSGELAGFHVIVSLQGAATDYFSQIPFHTTYLEWDLGVPPEGLDEVEVKQRYEEIYRELSYRIQDLMELLRGEGAD